MKRCLSAFTLAAAVPWSFIYAPTVREMKPGQSGYLPAGAFFVDQRRNGWVAGDAQLSPDLMTNSKLYVTQTRKGLDVEVETCEHIVWPLSRKPSHAAAVARIHQSPCGISTGHW